MSWLFSQALVAEYSAATCSGGEPSAPLSVMPTQHKFWRNDKTIEPLRLSQFGLTCAVLTGSHGKDLLTWFRADSRVRTYQLLAKVPVSKVSARDCGDKWGGSFAKYSPDTSSWKTAQCSLLADSDEFSEIWPKWGLMRRGAAYPLPTLVHTMKEKESGLWPTPLANSHTGAGHGPNKKGAPNLQTVVKRWPTPVASMSKGSSYASLTRKSGANRSNDRLDHAVMASDGGQLNPEWVEWLMGWPQGWTDLKPLEMVKFQEWQRQHSHCLEKSEVAA